MDHEKDSSNTTDALRLSSNLTLSKTLIKDENQSAGSLQPDQTNNSKSLNSSGVAVGGPPSSTNNNTPMHQASNNVREMLEMHSKSITTPGDAIRYAADVMTASGSFQVAPLITANVNSSNDCSGFVFDLVLYKGSAGLCMNVGAKDGIVSVMGFRPRPDGKPGPAEETGLISAGDYLTAVDGLFIQALTDFSEVVHRLRTSNPIRLQFQRIGRPPPLLINPPMGVLSHFVFHYITPGTLYQGVRYISPSIWLAECGAGNGGLYRIGEYTTHEKAAQAYNSYIISNYGEASRGLLHCSERYYVNGTDVDLSNGNRRPDVNFAMSSNRTPSRGVTANRRPRTTPKIQRKIQFVTRAILTQSQKEQLRAQIMAFKYLADGDGIPHNLLSKALLRTEIVSNEKKSSRKFVPMDSKTTKRNKLRNRIKARKRRRNPDAYYEDEHEDSDDDVVAPPTTEATEVKQPSRRSSRNAGKAVKRYNDEPKFELSEEELKEEIPDDVPVGPEIEKIVAVRFVRDNAEDEESEPVMEFYVKWKGKSYLHLSWLSVLEMENLGPKVVHKMRRYIQQYPYIVENARWRFLNKDDENVEYFNPSFLLVDRILDVKECEEEYEQEVRVKVNKPVIVKSQDGPAGCKICHKMEGCPIQCTRCSLYFHESCNLGNPDDSALGQVEIGQPLCKDCSNSIPLTTIHGDSNSRSISSVRSINTTSTTTSTTSTNVAAVDPYQKQLEKDENVKMEEEKPINEMKNLTDDYKEANAESVVVADPSTTLSKDDVVVSSTSNPTTTTVSQLEEVSCSAAATTAATTTPTPAATTPTATPAATTPTATTTTPTATTATTLAITEPECEYEISTVKKVRKGLKYFVKWCALSYKECTWEWEDDVKNDKKIAQYHRFNHPPLISNAHPAMFSDHRPPPSAWAKYQESPRYSNGKQLRNYQLEGLNWIIFCWYNRRNCILADEMGLGKTIQAVSVLEHLRQREHIRGPFLVVAPLATLGNWKREIETWTQMNCLLYHDSDGGAETRRFIQEHEFYFKPEKYRKKGMYKFNVLVTSYHILLADPELFERIHWRYIVVDEAHKLKNREAKILQVMQEFTWDSCLLMTGTPLQNGVEELWCLLNFIAPDKFSSQREFYDRYGDLASADQVANLHDVLRPYMLRRVKEDVEKSIPPKEETIIDVELTTMQKKYYRAIFEKNRAFLNQGSSVNVASLVNVEMELRKCCNHPYLIQGIEAKEVKGLSMEQKAKKLIQCSGKAVLLDKLLTKFKREKKKVLIFSQFKIMLDVLQDVLDVRGYRYERMDGSVRGNERQEAIDRFNNPASNTLIFLLSTRAGGVGINLIAATVVIMFDSDWNPQNDLQAVARCHRIGQTQPVQIFRLVTKKTYEAQMFEIASKKLGMHQAVFETGGVRKGFDGNEKEDGGMMSLLSLDKNKIEMMIRYGAYAIMGGDDEEGEGDANKYNEADIDQIISSSRTIRYDPSAGGVKGGGGEGEGEGGEGEGGDDDTLKKLRTNNTKGLLSFSKATFAAESSDANIDFNDEQFWEKVLGPKPSLRLMTQLQEGTLSNACEEDQKSFLLEVRQLAREVIDARQSGSTHEDAEQIMAILIEMKVLGPSNHGVDHRKIATQWLHEIEKPKRRRKQDSQILYHPYLDGGGEVEVPQRQSLAILSDSDHTDEGWGSMDDYVAKKPTKPTKASPGRRGYRKRNTTSAAAVPSSTEMVMTTNTSTSTNTTTEVKDKVNSQCGIIVHLRKRHGKRNRYKITKLSCMIPSVIKLLEKRAAQNVSTPITNLEEEEEEEAEEVDLMMVDTPKRKVLSDTEEVILSSSPPRNSSSSSSKKRSRRKLKSTSRYHSASSDDDKESLDSQVDSSSPPQPPLETLTTLVVQPKKAELLKTDDDDLWCCVCYNNEGFLDDPIVQCEKCGMAMHKFCYGIEEIPEGDTPWFCRLCEAFVEQPTECVLCPNNTRGAFKQTVEGYWSHVICGLWIPEVSFGDLTIMEPITDIDKIPQSRKDLTCSICLKNGSACIQCAYPLCDVPFHPFCGRDSRSLKMFMNDKGQLVAYCKSHSNLSSVA